MKFIKYIIKYNKNYKSNRKWERYGSIDKSKNEIIKLLNIIPK